MQYWFVVVFALSLINIAFADEPIPITASGTMDQVRFDGKWSFETEWKQASLNTYAYGDEIMILRSAHQGDFVYILIDMYTDVSVDKEDKAIVCFDAGNEKNTIADSNDFCFMALMSIDTGITYQGSKKGDHNFELVENHPELIAIGGQSDENDRYSTIPHSSYEFKIPTEVIGRNSVYGFYLSVFDANSQNYYSYPLNITSISIFSSPSQWGEIYSPDKSLPEFDLPLLLMFPALGIVLYFTRRQRITENSEHE